MRKVKIMLAILLSATLILAVTACAGHGARPSESSVGAPPGDLVLDRTEDTSGGIVVLGQPLEGYMPAVDGFNGVILVPLFPVAQRLGIETSWDEEEQMARVGEDIRIWVGKDHYARGDGDPITFGPAPQLIDGILYVPMYFFEFVVGGYKAHIADSAVVIERAAQ